MDINVYVRSLYKVYAAYWDKIDGMYTLKNDCE